MRGTSSLIASLAALAAVGALVVAPGATATPATASATPKCTTSLLDVWLDNSEGGGTAGSFYYKLAFTNFSSRTCTLRGAPGVVAADVHGHPVGSPAGTTSGGPTVRLRPGATATAVLRAVDPGVFTPSECQPVLAAGLCVKPPGQSAAKFVPFPLEVCSRVGHSSLEVQSVKAS
ncbi:MAG TPA: DUF4232 domain-containing protein [Solirubrobacterales bacterium]